ncbi:MAG: HlyD family efflux transporter periplasmic adaptor subunit [Cyanobacteria bacterium P01_B01_bin.77]
MEDARLNDSEFSPVLPQQIRQANSDDFLPSLGNWTVIGGLVILAGFMGTIALSAVLKYKVVVQAPAAIRPAGELRLVEAGTDGIIEQIKVNENQFVQAGEILAIVNNSSLETQRQQLLDTIASIQQQLSQIQAQLTALDQQIAAETEQLQRSISSAEASLRLNQRGYQDALTESQADLKEAEASLTLAQDELQRYQQLADTGAISELQIGERIAAVEIAKARLERVTAALNPTNAEVDIAKERIVQEEARGNAIIARLHQEHKERLRQYQELENQLERDREALDQVDKELDSTAIRAPISGTILELNLRNVEQVVNRGDEIAQIAPTTDTIVLKALVAPQDINKVEIGQVVKARISACPYPDYGTLPGIVEAISPDAVISTGPNEQTVSNLVGTNYQGTYSVDVQPEHTSLSAQGEECVLQPGMEGRADIISQQESVLRFVLRKARLLVN